MNRETHLEHIEANPEDEGAYLVFADWLQERDDPWGKLIVLQHQLEAEPGNDVIAASVDALLRKHRHEWCADLYNRPAVILEWRWGFIRSARVLAGYDDYVARVDALLASPLCRALSELV